ncbi:MAG: Zn-ribbon domain-containing OB-fold protein [Actinomycetota bacterium]
MSDNGPPFRILPRVHDLNRHFWTGGEDGELRFLRCQDDGYYIHPPVFRCPKCLGKNVAPEDVSGRATVLTYSINHQQWMPGPEVPYVVAIVEIVEQEGLRLTTNIVKCDIDAVRIGMPVRVLFEEHADPSGEAAERVWIPLFEPMKTDGEQ